MPIAKRENDFRPGWPSIAGILLLCVLVGTCVGLLLGSGPERRDAKSVYAGFLAKDVSSYGLDGRLDVRMTLAGGDGAVVSGIPATVSIGFSDQVVDHSAKGSTSMRLSVLELSDGYDLENYARYDPEDASFDTYFRSKSGGEWGEWGVQSGYSLTLDSRALFRGAYLLDGKVSPDGGTYYLAVRPDEVWDALKLDGVLASLTGEESLDRTAYKAAMSASIAVYEVSAETGYLTAVDADGFELEVGGNMCRASFRVEFSGYGEGGDVAVPESVMASAVQRENSLGMDLLELPGGAAETVTGVTTEDVDEDSWSSQFSGDYGFDVVKYDDGTWHVLDMDGNEIEGAEAYDDGRVYHPEYGWIYPDYETDNG